MSITESTSSQENFSEASISDLIEIPSDLEFPPLPVYKRAFWAPTFQQLVGAAERLQQKQIPGFTENTDWMMLVEQTRDRLLHEQFEPFPSLYEVPVQKSAFEARLERSEIKLLIEELERLIDKEEDSLHVYSIPKDVEPKIVELGKPRPSIIVEDYFILE